MLVLGEGPCRSFGSNVFVCSCSLGLGTRPNGFASERGGGGAVVLMILRYKARKQGSTKQTIP